MHAIASPAAPALLHRDQTPPRHVCPSPGRRPPRQDPGNEPWGHQPERGERRTEPQCAATLAPARPPPTPLHSTSRTLGASFSPTHETSRPSAQRSWARCVPAVHSVELQRAADPCRHHTRTPCAPTQVAKILPDLDARGVKVLALSVDSVESHKAWTKVRSWRALALNQRSPHIAGHTPPPAAAACRTLRPPAGCL